MLLILGGAKIIDKVKLLNNVINRCDKLMIGGAMAFGFLKVRDNFSIGDSYYDQQCQDDIK